MAQTATLRRPTNSRPTAGVKKSKAAHKAPASSTINLRIDNENRSLIDRARGVIGENRTDFMIKSARLRAQEVLLSQTHFTLSDAAWADFQAALEAPALPTKALVALMASKAPWED